jgi:hypothetical protein
MAITYTKPEIANNETSVNVTFTNDDGFVYTRSINVPYKDGILDEAEWNQRLEDHLRSVIHKSGLRVITFTDPNAVIEETSANTVANI